jgi:F-type H+-transporting ATPase subunit epsilon
MADTMTFSLVSPERLLAEVDAVTAQIPGIEGDFTAMPAHAPFVSTLRPGMVRVAQAGGEISEYFVTGGFAEVSAEATSVLAEEAVGRDELRREWLEAKLADAEAALESAIEADKIAAGQKVYDFRAAIDLFGG